MSHWHEVRELFWNRLGETSLFTVPATAFEVESFNIDSIFGTRLHIVNLENFKAHCHQVDRDRILSGKVLHCTSQKRLGKEESGDPEHGWDAIVNPGLEKLETCNKVGYIRTLFP